ncbi:hypothetical protein VTL71DRAFT_16346 [Oculimacula yallundae]|uniref:Oxidase ustYa n=1 Tax=Oculimacula yallundae TaxID=86028 RepID=A0ABR4CEC2_9HELO
MSSPKFPIFSKSGYKELINSDSWDEFVPVRQHGGLARKYFPGYRIAFFGMCALYVLSMSMASILITHPKLLEEMSTSRLIPNIPRDKTVVFNGFKSFEMPRAKNDAWSKLMPSGKGFVELPVEVPLPSGGVEVRKESFCISMFHQLHCIAGLKSAFDAMSNPENDASASMHHAGHLNHCFDYLRQGVMCAGDMTLEPTFELTGEDEGTRGVNGWNVEHQCRNWQMMYDFAEEHRFLNSSGI